VKINLLSVKDNLKVLQSFEKTCTAYKPNIDELEDINQVTYLHGCVEKSHHCHRFRVLNISIVYSKLEDL
jgi:G:T-mismatch repair DNA endonuclease (very short patch repair protein)